MEWILASLIVLGLSAVAVVAAGRGGAMAPAAHDRPDLVLPSPIGPADLRAVRLTVAPRGYRMSEVDELLERLAAQLDVDTGQGSGPG